MPVKNEDGTGFPIKKEGPEAFPIEREIVDEDAVGVEFDADVSPEFVAALNARVYELLDEASQRAEANDRKTVFARDL